MSKYWCWTANNPPEDVSALADMEGVQFMVYQKEVGENGTPHLQGYVVFRVRRRLSQVRNLFFQVLNSYPHFEKRKGTHDQAKDYCTKDDTRAPGCAPVFVGNDAGLGGQGKRNDLLSMKRALDEGKSELEIAESDETFSVWAKYYKSIERYKRLKSVQSRQWPTITYVLYGPPGGGKTRWAAEKYPDAYWLPKPGQGQTPFFDGYDGHETVVIDEFYGWLPFDLLCRMCDRYPLMVNTKGGMVSFYPKRIIFTSNAHPNEWYKRGLGALERRFQYPLGVMQWCPVPFNGVVRLCGWPVMFRDEAHAASYTQMHSACDETRCFVLDPVPQAPVAVDPPVVVDGVNPPVEEEWLASTDEDMEYLAAEILADMDNERDRLARSMSFRVDSPSFFE